MDRFGAGPERSPEVIPKVGMLNEPGVFGGAQMAIYTVEKQPFHVIRDGMLAVERLSKRKGARRHETSS